MNKSLVPYRDKIAETIDGYKNAHHKVQAKRVMNVMFPYVMDIAKKAWEIGRNSDDPTELYELLTSEGLMEKSKFLPIEYYLDHYGADIPIQKIDSSKLIGGYNVGDPTTTGQVIKVTNWFNGSVIRYKGKLIMAYRMDVFPWTVNTRIALCQLDEKFNVIEGSNIIPLLRMTDGMFIEDPRLFIFKDELWLSYADGHTIGLIQLSDPYVRDSLAFPMTVDPENILLDKPINMLPEKNWTFFEHEGKLMMVYSINPHKIYEVRHDKIIKQHSEEFPSHHWKWGEPLRGSTCPIMLPKNHLYYFSFFHSHIEFPEEMKNFIHRQYHFGCYVFKAEPPFKVVAMSKEPIMSGPYIDPSIPHGGNHNFNIFPMGAYFEISPDGGEWVISAGINDYEIGIIKIPHEKVLENLLWF